MGGIRKAMDERNLNEGQWEDKKQWSLGVRQSRKKFLKPIYKYILNISALFQNFHLFIIRFFAKSITIFCQFLDYSRTPFGERRLQHSQCKGEFFFVFDRRPDTKWH
jgi:hypothetical protein